MIPVVLLHALGSSAPYLVQVRGRAASCVDRPGRPRREVTADTLWLAGGPTSHVDQDRIHEAAARMPSARVVEVPVGHRIHSEAPDEFAAAVLPFLLDSAE